MKHWMTWLIVLCVCGGMLLCSGGMERSMARAAEGECGEDADGDPNLLTIYHSWGDLVPDEFEDEGAGAVTMVASDSSQGHLILLEVCVPDAGKDKSGNAIKSTVSLKLSRGADKIELFKMLHRVPLTPEELTFGSAVTLWLQAKDASEDVGDIEICAETKTESEEQVEGCQDWIKITAMQLDLDIYHGGRESNPEEPVLEDEEDTRGAFTVVNRNDTDANGNPDYNDIDVSATADGRDETDLMRLDISLTPDSLVEVLPIDGLDETVRLNVPSGAVKFWHFSTKGNPFDPEIPLFAAVEQKVWVEATEPSTGLGDIEIELDFMGVQDRVKATAIWPEIDVREAARPENRVGRDDPRPCPDPSVNDLAQGKIGNADCLAWNSLLVWHDRDDDNAISFEVVKTELPDPTSGAMLDNNSPLWIQLEKKEYVSGRTWEFLSCEILSQDVKDFQSLQILSNPSIPTMVFDMIGTLSLATLDDIEDHFIADVLVKYGLDYDGSGALSGDEIRGEYNIFGITQDDYIQAQSRYNLVYLPGTLSKLGQALCYRVSHGVWEELAPHAPHYSPTKDGACTPGQEIAIHGLPDSCNAGAPGSEKVLERKKKEYPTHNLGMSFSNHTSTSADVSEYDGTDGTYPRQYFDAKATVPVYYWPSDSHASQLVKDSHYLREWILDKFLLNKKRLTFADINSKYGSATGKKMLTFSVPQDQGIDFSPYKSIGLGFANLNPSYFGKFPEIILEVEKFDAMTYDILRKITLKSFGVDDGFDYNYFKPGMAKASLASVSGSTMQSSFGQAGALPKDGQILQTTGQVPRERIEIDGEHDLVPEEFTNLVATFRIRKVSMSSSDASWFTVNSNGAETPIKNFKDGFDFLMFKERKIPFDFEMPWSDE